MDDAWIPVEVPEMDSLPGAVYPRMQPLPHRHAFPKHTHPWHQLIYATSGTMLVEGDDFRSVITPEQAIWVPRGVLHDTRALSDAAFRNLYVADLPGLDMPGTCALLAVSPLLRALIIELADLEGGDPAYAERIGDLILAHLPRLRRWDLNLPWPRDPSLTRICEALYAEPDDDRGMAHWSAMAGCSPRTLTRRFEGELGMTLRDWRRRVRLFRAVEWLGTGRPVTQVALDLGYSSPSAFSHMFRMEMGVSPTDWRTGEGRE
jgi:AraC-like DNA-binding protein